MNEAPPAWIETLISYLMTPYAQAAIIVLFFLLLAKVADVLLTKICAKLTQSTSSDFDDKLTAMLHRPILVTFAMIGFGLASIRLLLPATVAAILQSVFKTVLIGVWLIFGISFMRLLLSEVLKRPDTGSFPPRDTVPLLRNLLTVVLVIAAVYSVLVAWGINVTGLVASAGIVGLALSFAAQDTLSHLFAGVAILMDKPYKIGDYVVLDTGERGEVKGIGLRSTRLLTRDDVEVTIPNGVMGSAKIVNESGGPHTKYRMRVKVGVAYGSDIDKVMEILMSTAKEHEDVCTYPEPRVRFRMFGESSLDFELLCWIREPSMRGLVMHEMNCRVYKEFNDNQITIPFAQRDINIKGLPDGFALSNADAD